MGRAGKKLSRLGLQAGQSSTLLPDSFDVEDPEASYAACVPLAHRKRYAQFFTPEPIARLMAEWISEINPSNVLDPACGPGILLRVMCELIPRVKLTAIDIDAVALEACRQTLEGEAHLDLLHADFLLWEKSSKFDGIIANPPYLRHHDLQYPFDIFDALGSRHAVKLSRLTNIYVMFILEICRRLSPGGRAAVIVPGEWTNANFGSALKQFLLSRGLLHSLLYFSHLGSHFEDALTTAAVLLLEKPKARVRRKSFRSLYIEESFSMSELAATLAGCHIKPRGIIEQQLDAAEMLLAPKWDRILQDGHQVFNPGFVPLSALASSKRGIATGANKFFHLTNETVCEFQIRRENLRPCIGRAADVKGFVFSSSDFENLAAANRRCFLFDLQTKPNAHERRYLDLGVQQRLESRYLLAQRSPWYAMEQRKPAPIWAAVFGRQSLRFVLNRAGLSNLTTFHCLYPKIADPQFAAALTACLNSRLVQRTANHQLRVYGGGLLKFEPRDLLSIQVPDLRLVPPSTLKLLSGVLDRIDRCCKNGTLNPDGLFEELDGLVLRAANQAANIS